MKKFKIENPCSEKWEAMENLGEDKFCNKCEKKVYNSVNLNLDKIDNSNPICGKKTLLKPAFSTVFLAFTLATTSCTTLPSTSNATVEDLYQNEITISGKIISKRNRKIISSEISFITLEKAYYVKADENGNFTIMLPEKFLNERNVVRIDFTVIENNNQKIKDNTASIISKRELMGLKDFPIDERYVIIGAVVISSYEPPDLYYFNGVKINKGKFDRIKLENPNFKYYVFYDEVIGQKLSNETDMNKLFLLYSN